MDELNIDENMATYDGGESTRPDNYSATAYSSPSDAARREFVRFLLLGLASYGKLGV